MKKDAGRPEATTTTEQRLDVDARDKPGHDG
jgi:hypothetical protein